VREAKVVGGEAFLFDAELEENTKFKEVRMKKVILVFTLLLGVVFFMAQTPALAATFTFGDNNNYWPTWANGTSDDGDDVIGGPDILGGSASFSPNGWEFRFDYKWGNDNLEAGDVFLDMNADGYWDYIIASGNCELGVGLYEVNELFSFSEAKGDNDGYYAMSDDYFGSGSNYREAHPVGAINVEIATEVFLLNKIADISFTDFGSGIGTVVFSGNYPTGDPEEDFIIGFGPTCANDMVYETVRVPEPTTLLLMGFGLVGLGLCSSRKFLVRKKG